MGYFLSFLLEIFGFLVDKSNTMIYSNVHKGTMKEVENDNRE